MILDETLQLLKEKHGEQFSQLLIEQVVAGMHFTAVKLSNGNAGLAAVDSFAMDCCRLNRRRGFGEFTPGNFKGQLVERLFLQPADSALMRNLQLTVMNALSAGWLREPEYRIIEDKDPLELIDLQPDISICLVGAFFSYMQKISAAGSKLKIVELDKNAIPGEYHQHYIPAVDAGKAFATADVILITGATLANQSLENLLNQVPSGKNVIVVGPSGSLLPDALFDRGVQLVGATRIVDSDKMLSLVAEGAAGFHLFHYCAQKICILNEK